MNRALAIAVGLAVAAIGTWWFATYSPLMMGSDYIGISAEPLWDVGLLWGVIFGLLAWALTTAVLQLLRIGSAVAVAFATAGSIDLVLAALLLRALLTDWQVESPEWAVERVFWFAVGVYVAILVAAFLIARRQRPIIETHGG